MTRITNTQLQAVVDRINRTLSRPMEPYTKGDDGQYHANIGNYHLSHAYGGVALHCMFNDGGGVSDVFGCHMPRRELYGRLHAFIAGLETERA